MLHDISFFSDWHDFPIRVVVERGNDDFYVRAAGALSVRPDAVSAIAASVSVGLLPTSSSHTGVSVSALSSGSALGIGRSISQAIVRSF